MTLEIRVILEKLEPRALRDQLAHKDPQELKVIREPWAPWDPRVLRELCDSRDLLGLKGKLETRGHRGIRV